MKKNKMMRLASFLMAAVLLTASVISGTFAKYTTSAEGNDSARVAKWGVSAEVIGEAFSSQYETDDDAYTLSTYSVVGDERVLAPGTEGTFGGVKLSGIPEVAVRISYSDTTKVELNDTWKDADDNFYCPVVFNINGTEVNGLEYDDEQTLEIALVKAVKQGAKDYPAKTDLSKAENLNGSYSWKWAFEGKQGSKQTNERDTYLGSWQQLGHEAPAIAFYVEVTVEQID